MTARNRDAWKKMRSAHVVNGLKLSDGVTRTFRWSIKEVLDHQWIEATNVWPWPIPVTESIWHGEKHAGWEKSNVMSELLSYRNWHKVLIISGAYYGLSNLLKNLHQKLWSRYVGLTNWHITRLPCLVASGMMASKRRKPDQQPLPG